MLALFPDSVALEGASLEIGGLTAEALAEEHGTPLVVLCEETVRANARALRAALGHDGRVFFGTKAFPNVALLRLLDEEGIGADVASEGELAFARRAGLGGDRLVVHGNNKDEAFLRAAAASGAPVVLDAPDEAGLAAAAGVAQVLVRVTLGVDADTHEAIRTGHHGSKFGLPPTQARTVVAEALDLGLDVLGVHVHVGSQLADFDAQAETIVRLAGFVASCRDELGWTAQVADLGGGFGIRHRPEDDVPEAADLAAAAVVSARAAFVSVGLPEPMVWLEPGRSLVGRAGVTLYRVGAVKRLSDRTWATLDLGSPPTAWNAPPRYQPPAPSDTTAFTTPATFGKSGTSAPVDASIATALPVAGPTRVKSPPRYTEPPDWTMEWTGPFGTQNFSSSTCAAACGPMEIERRATRMGKAGHRGHSTLMGFLPDSQKVIETPERARVVERRSSRTMPPS